MTKSLKQKYKERTECNYSVFTLICRPQIPRISLVKTNWSYSIQPASQPVKNVGPGSIVENYKYSWKNV
jgi:hypothetical protein